jgi:type I restriction enzyme M protein
MGEIPFVRTSDIVNWEIKIDPVKGIPEEIYQMYKEKQDIKAGDILFVKDGTFLIGRTAFVTSLDEKIVIQSHILKIRVNKETKYINPYYLIYLLNLPIVKKQIRTKTFIQGTISTIGNRIMEIVLPIKKEEVEKITTLIKDIIYQKELLRKKMIKLIKNNDF